MLYALLSCALIFALLVASEMLWNHKTLHGEFGRKFVHITVGGFVAFWPFFMSWDMIVGISIALLIVICLSYKFNFFRVIHTVERKTYGEISFALVIALLALTSPSELVFTIAVLHLSLADGLAAILGTRYGKSNQYEVLGHKRSIVGTVTCYVVSLGLITCLVLGQSGFEGQEIIALTLIPFLVTLVENFSVRGLDNLTVPAVVALSARLFM